MKCLLFPRINMQQHTFLLYICIYVYSLYIYVVAFIYICTLCYIYNVIIHIYIIDPMLQMKKFILEDIT